MGVESGVVLRGFTVLQVHHGLAQVVVEARLVGLSGVDERRAGHAADEVLHQVDLFVHSAFDDHVAEGHRLGEGLLLGVLVLAVEVINIKVEVEDLVGGHEAAEIVLVVAVAGGVACGDFVAQGREADGQSLVVAGIAHFVVHIEVAAVGADFGGVEGDAFGVERMSAGGCHVEAHIVSRRFFRHAGRRREGGEGGLVADGRVAFVGVGACHGGEFGDLSALGAVARDEAFEALFAGDFAGGDIALVAQRPFDVDALCEGGHAGDTCCQSDEGSLHGISLLFGRKCTTIIPNRQIFCRVSSLCVEYEDGFCQKIGF